MPDNEAERPTTAPPEPAAADEAPATGDTPSDPTTAGAPEATARSHRQRSHRSARTRLVRRRSARRMQNSEATTPAQPRLTRRRQHSEASSTGPGPRRRTRSQRLANGTSATQRSANRTSTTARKPASGSSKRQCQTGASDGPAAARRPSCNRRLHTAAVARPRVSRTARAIERWAKTHRPSSRLPPAWGDRSNCRQDVGRHSELPGPTVMRWPAAQPIERWERVRAVPSTRLQARLQELPSTVPWVAHRYRFTARSHRCTRATPPRTAASPRDRRRGPHAVAVCAALPSGPAPVAPTRPHAATTRLHVARSLPRHGAVISATPPVIPAHAVIQALGSE